MGTVDELANSRHCVVLGGRGFVGRSLVLTLLELGNCTIRIADSAPSLQLEEFEPNAILLEAITTRRVSYVHADIRNKVQLMEAFRGSSVVFFTDSVSLISSDFYDSYKLVVQGAKNVIKACGECKVKRLVYHSSADVVFDGYTDIHDVDESMPYPLKYKDHSWDLIRQAEALILRANDTDSLLTCSLRASNTFGPGDSFIVPFFTHQDKVCLGEGTTDFTFVDNLAHALIRSEDALRSQTAAAVAGKPFFITNDRRIRVSDFVASISEFSGYCRPTMIRILLYYYYYPMNWLLPHHRHHHPLSARHLFLDCITRTFNCSRAQKYLNYRTVVSLEDGMRLIGEWIADVGRVEESDTRVSGILGGGKVAEVLLWRDERRTFSCFATVMLLHCTLFLSGRTFISSAATLIFLLTLFLFFLPSSVFGLEVDEIPASYFEVSGIAVRDFVAALTRLWNLAFYDLSSLAVAQDWTTFFKVAFCLYVVKLVLSFSFSALVGAGLVLAFTTFFIYEQCQEEIDCAVTSFLNHLKFSHTKFPFSQHFI